jgi:hypothetical protein
VAGFQNFPADAACRYKYALHCRLFDAIRFQIVKHLTAILFSVVLVWMQVASTPVSSLAVCEKPAMGNCAACCDRVACCTAKPASNSQPAAPAIPTQSSVQNQISLLAPAIVAWTLPENPANTISSVTALPLMATGTPLYARNCTLLL